MKAAHGAVGEVIKGMKLGSLVRQKQMLTKQVSLFPAYLKSLRLRKIFDFIILWSLALQPAQDPSPLERFFFFFWCYFPLGLYPRFQGYSSWRQGRWEVIFSLRDIFKNSISLIIKKDKVFPYSKQVKRGNEHDFAAHTCIRKEKHGRQRKIYRWERRNGNVAMLEFIVEQIKNSICDRRGQDKRYTCKQRQIYDLKLMDLQRNIEEAERIQIQIRCHQ